MAGNVETSQRLVDALLCPGRQAAGQGTMNNLTIGAEWALYETIGGGSGAAAASGSSAVQIHLCLRQGRMWKS